MFVFTLGCFLATILCFVTGIIVCTVSVGPWRILAYMYYFFDLFGITLIFHFSQLYRRKEKVMEHKKVFFLYVLLLLFMIVICLHYS